MCIALGAFQRDCGVAANRYIGSIVPRSAAMPLFVRQ